ncbi:MAG: VapC toxin family PIN domain ribonuclease, partial [Mariprofundaceae bacterium]|nr:VapC toxin family PIN domain ribonuclease [Mariprofundaceae bacterium]
MILLDTNIISEVMRPQPVERVLHWLDQHTVDGLWLSSISIAEIHYGLAVLPIGQRRELLTSRFVQ